MLAQTLGALIAALMCDRAPLMDRWRIVVYPHVSGVLGLQGAAKRAYRLEWLLQWDALAFRAVSLLFVVMVAIVADADVRSAEVPSGVAWAPLSLLTQPVAWAAAIGWHLVTPTFWAGWRVEISFNICYAVFALSAFPFCLLMIPFINKLFTLAVPTAYNENGQLTYSDTYGLSACLRNLRCEVLEAPRFARELRDDFTQPEVERLWKALRFGEAALQAAWSRPRTMWRATQRALQHVLDEVEKVVTKAKASEALYKQCFPDAVLVEQYKARKRRHNEHPSSTAEANKDVQDKAPLASKDEATVTQQPGKAHRGRHSVRPPS